jgi:hypothetical protein
MRKVVSDGGAAMNAMLDSLSTKLSNTKPHEAQVLQLFTQIKATTHTCLQAAQQPDGQVRLSWIAGDYLRLATLGLLAWSWTRIEAAEGSNSNRWQAPAAALRAWVLPEAGMRSGIIAAQLGH